MVRNLFLLFLLFTVTSTKAQTTDHQTSLNRAKPDSISDIPFKKINDTLLLKLDIYYPRNRTASKGVIIYFHGGGWALGDKAPIRVGYRKSIIDGLLSENYTIISAQYRLISKNIHFPEPVQDSKDAIRWVRKYASEYDLNTNYIGVWGDSAGGQLAMLSAYSKAEDFTGDPELSGYSAKVNFVLNNYGPVEMNEIFRTNASCFTMFLFKTFAKKIFVIRQKLINGITGTDITEDPNKVRKLFELYSPINYITSETVPTLTLQGGKDNTVPVQQAILLHEKLNEYGIPNELKIYPKANHGFSNLDAATEADAATRMLNFVKKYQP